MSDRRTLPPAPRTRPVEPDRTVEVAELPAAPHAGWWRTDPPRIDEALRGIRYTLVTDRAASQLIGAGEVLDAWAGIGPRCFFGREGRFVAYDPALYDQNLGVRVCERAWPASLGDRVWVALGVAGEALVMDLDAYGWTIVLLGDLEHAAAHARVWVRTQALEVTRGLAGAVDPVNRFTGPGPVRR